MESSETCPECGASLAGAAACQDHFYQMLYWENERPENGEVHHLTVLCYFLQHPSRYSPEGLGGAKGLLVDFLERGLNPQDVRRRDRTRVSSSNRRYKITASPQAAGAYAHPVRWGLTARDVVAGGIDAYRENVRRWASSVLDALRSSENL